MGRSDPGRTVRRIESVQILIQNRLLASAHLLWDLRSPS